jgi:hypothetical protein
LIFRGIERGESSRKEELEMEQTLRCDCRRLRTTIAVSLLVVTLAGCGGSGTATEVTGTVKMNGAPLPGGKVTFVYADGKTNPATTIIQQDGKYTLVLPPEGAVKIAVEGQGRPSVVQKGAPPPTKIPAKYTQAQSSGLTYTIIKGKQTKDLELKTP